MAHLSLSLLGPLQITLDGELVTNFRYDKVRALLAYLAVEADRPQRRQTLLGLLWPDLPESAARNNLRQALVTLRQAIGDQSAAPPFLLTTRDSLQFHVASDHECDVAKFTALLDACERHPHRHRQTCTACAQRLWQAVALYQGDFLSGFSLADSEAYEEWTLLKREWLRRRVLQALVDLTAYHERRGDYELACRALQHQLDLDAWREEAHRRLMHLLALRGQRSAALAQYEQCRRLLQAELGVEPEAETTALYAQIRERPADAPLAEGERAPAGDSPARLPSPPTPFVGREAELAELERLLDETGCRLLTLTGPGGVGKTRLALQAAANHAHAFADGVRFVSLASLNSADYLISALADGLEIPLTDPARPKQQLLAALRDQELLLVLDNFEHLLAGAGLLAETLAHAPEVMLLVTSRERLNVQGEWIFDVEGLPVPTLADGGSRVEESGAVQLFVQTARRVQAGFTLSATNVESIVRLCRLVEGLPLAIELAAAWVRALSCREIVQEIESGLHLLTTSLRDVSERHRSLRAVFDHSWALLAPDEHAVLRKLSVFRGGCSRAAAAQVAGAALPILATLVDKSLLRWQPTGRYELHDLLRQYAWEKLQESGEAACIQEQHLACFLQLAESAEPHLEEMQSAAWLRQLDVEHGNLRAALTWAATSDNAESGLRLASALWRYWWLRGYSEEDREWLAALLDGNGSAPLGLRAKAHRAAGGLAYYQTDLVQAEWHFARALPLFQAAGDKAGICQALRNLATTWGDQGRYVEARDYLAKSLARARELQDSQNMANALSELAIFDYYLDDCPRAIANLEESVALNRVRGDQHDLAMALHNLAEVVGSTGDYARASSLYQEALSLFQTVESKYGCAFSLQAQGEAACAQNDLARARALLAEGMSLFQELGHVYGVGLSLSGLAGLALKEGRPKQAARLLGAVERLIDEGLVILKPPERRRYQQTLAGIQAQLDEATFTAAWTEGRALSLEEFDSPSVCRFSSPRCNCASAGVASLLRICGWPIA